MKKFTLLLSTLLLLALSSINSQSLAPYHPDDETSSESCTSIMVGKNASTDGSVMTAHSCDSNYRTWLTLEKRRKYNKGDMEPVRWWTLHNEEPWDNRNIEEKGKIPAIEETYKYLNVAYPCLNEKQLAMGETTTSGRRELRNIKGLFLIEELERIALQRSSSARDAIKLMGELAQKYGYGDDGECLTVADKKEVWHFEIYGSGPGEPSALWVAQRIPDDHVGVSANIPRIGIVDFNDKDNFMYSHDLRDRAQKLGYWDGKEPFKFYKVVSTMKPFSIREYWVLSSLAPSLNLKYDADELPFSVKPDKKVSPQDVLAFYRATYEGSEYDQVKNLAVEVPRRQRLDDGSIREYTDTVYPVSTFMPADMRTLLNKISPGVTDRIRTIAAIQCSYSWIAQLRDWLPDEVGGVVYFSFDNPAQSPRIPIYCGGTSLPESFYVCGQHRYREDAAIWAFRETNRISTINWDKTRHLLEPEVTQFEQMMFELAPDVEEKAAELIKAGKVEEAQRVLDNHTANFASMTMKRWQQLKAPLWQIFARSM